MKDLSGAISTGMLDLIAPSYGMNVSALGLTSCGEDIWAFCFNVY